MSNSNSIDKHKVEYTIHKFLLWLDRFGEYSFDRMDFNTSKLGIYTKRLLYKNRLLGLPFAAFALIQETFFPFMLKLYAKPRREAIGDAQYALGLFNMYSLTNNKEYLSWGEHYLAELKKSAIKGYSGMCWGYTFGWETSDGFWPAGIPLITVTPYCFWAFKKHYELTNNVDSLDICRSISQFVLKDFKKHKMPNGTVCSSYSPIDTRYVINANAYRANVLLDAYKLFGGEEYRFEAEMNISFVLSYQEPDGKWYYEAFGKRDRFVDNFHTCFVMRALYHCYEILDNEDIINAVKRGYKYYRKHLIRADHTPIHLSEIKYHKLRKYEMYDYAEGIKLGCILDLHIPGALDLSKILAGDLIRRFQLKDGHFVTRVNICGVKNKIPYHRWPQAQLFYALTIILRYL